MLLLSQRTSDKLVTMFILHPDLALRNDMIQFSYDIKIQWPAHYV